MKVAIVILADPAGGEDAVGRVFNALGLAYDVQQRGGDAKIIFQSTGTRWFPAITESGHPANGLYELTKSNIVGVSQGCATAFGALDGAAACGLPLLNENAVPGTPGLTSLAKYIADGYQLVTF